MNNVNVKFTSWNCRGLNKTVKIKQVLDRMKLFKSKIIFLQESHLMPSDINRLRSRWPGQVISASYSSHSRGVITLIHKSIPYEVQQTVCDPAGRFIIIQGKLLSEQLNLINVYGPNDDNYKFFLDLFLNISTLSGKYIIAGDFNCALNPAKDRTPGSTASHTQSRRIIQQFMQDLNLVDIWRELKPDTLEYSCHSSTHQSYSRIDFFSNFCKSMLQSG